MADKSTIFDPSATDSVSGITDGYGRPNVPPNYDAGTFLGEGVGYGHPLAFATDIICDPTDTDGNDPTRGYNFPGRRVSEA